MFARADALPLARLPSYWQGTLSYVYVGELLGPTTKGFVASDNLAIRNASSKTQNHHLSANRLSFVSLVLARGLA